MCIKVDMPYHMSAQALSHSIKNIFYFVKIKICFLKAYPFKDSIKMILCILQNQKIWSKKMAKPNKVDVDNETQENLNTQESKENFKDKMQNRCSKLVEKCGPIVDTVRETVLNFGEIILTISVIIGVISAIIGGLADMGNVGFFTGLVNMFQGIVTVVMSALVIFLLFAIKRNTEK